MCGIGLPNQIHELEERDYERIYKLAMICKKLKDSYSGFDSYFNSLLLVFGGVGEVADEQPYSERQKLRFAITDSLVLAES